MEYLCLVLTTDIKQKEELSTEEEDSSEMDWISYEEDSSEEEQSRELNIEERSRRKEEKKFLDLCGEGDLETVKTLLAEDPSLISCKDPVYGKFKMH